jgi:serine/threonine-protein kinase
MRTEDNMGIDITWLQKQFPDISKLTPLGIGGQKNVFSGTHANDGEIVLKLFHLGSDRERATREVQAVATISSPRVPKIFASGILASPTGDVIWLREHRLQGENLRERLKKGPLDAASAMRLALHVAEALDIAEKNRIVHRDVKPDNIFVDTAGNFWLLDFGLARHLDKESLTATGAAFGVGTLGYSPAEQFRNRKDDIDGRADLFALGVTLYESLQGKNPFREGARDFAEILRRVETMPLPAITAVVGADSDFRDLVEGLSRTKRDHRIPSTAEALAWIQEICKKNGIK